MVPVTVGVQSTFWASAGTDFTVYMSSTPPPANSIYYSNWLPIGHIPSSTFAIILRLYGPNQAEIYGQYQPPLLVAYKGTFGPLQV